MGQFKVTTENGTFLVTTEDQPSQSIDNQEPQSNSFISKIFSGLKEVASLPITFPQKQYESAKSVFESGIEADKRYPAENLLPAVGATAGALGGQLIKIPYASTFLSGIGSAIGEKARQGIRFLRGKPPDEGNALKEGVYGAAAELGGSAVAKILKAPFNKGMARSGLAKFTDKISELLKPTQLKEADNLFEAVKSKPVSSASDTLEFIQNFLDSRGYRYQPSADAIRRRMISESLTGNELMQANEELIKAKAPKLVSDLKTPVLKEFEPMADILDDLSNPDLNYGQLTQIKERVKDLANFGVSDRSTADKLFGSIYGNLNKDLARTAEENGFYEAHKLIADQKRKAVQSGIMNDMIERSKISDASGDRLSFTRIAKNLDMTDKEMKMIFGEDSNVIKSLKDLSSEYAARFPNRDLIHPFVSSKGHIGATAQLFNVAGNVESPVRAAETVFKRRGIDPAMIERIFPGTAIGRGLRSGIFQFGSRAILPDERR